MRVGQLGSDVQLKVVVVRYHRVSQFDDGAAGLLEGLVDRNSKEKLREVIYNLFP